VAERLQGGFPGIVVAVSVCFADGYGAHVSFDENGDSKGRYNIMNFRRNRATRRYEYVTVGRWADELHMDVDNYGVNRIIWAGGKHRHFINLCSSCNGRQRFPRVTEIGTHCSTPDLLLV